MAWNKVTERLPEEGKVVLTLVDDGDHVPRMVQKLKRKGSLWLIPDDSTYVCYTPTHWSENVPC